MEFNNLIYNLTQFLLDKYNVMRITINDPIYRPFYTRRNLCGIHFWPKKKKKKIQSTKQNIAANEKH